MAIALRQFNRMKKAYTLFWSGVLVLASTRGALVYHLGLSPNTTYTVSAMLLVCFGLISFWNLLNNRVDKSLVKLKNAIIINIFLLSVYSIVTISLLGTGEVGIVYLFAIFPIIFTIVKYDKYLLEGIVHAITAITAFGVYIISLIGISGDYYELVKVQQMLRPDEVTVSRIGENLLSFGYQGSNHDAGNILAMCSIFYLCKTINACGFSRFIYMILFSMLFFLALLTGSATNITVMIGFISIVAMTIANTMPRKVAGISIIIFGFFLIPLLNKNIVDIFYFADKYGYQDTLPGGGIFNYLDTTSIFNSLFSILFGFGYVLQVPLINSEVGFIKLLVQVGLFPALFSMFIVFSPVYYLYVFRRSVNNRARAIRKFHSASSFNNITSIDRSHLRQLTLSAMPVLCGTLTLLHYGSLFRVTSIGLFCVFMALFYKKYISFSSSLRNEM